MTESTFETPLSKANALAKLGKNREAERLFNLVVKSFEAAGLSSSTHLAEALRTRCFVRFGLARRARLHSNRWMTAAISDYARALEIWEAGPQNRDLSANLTNLGSLYYRNGQYAEALQCHEKALAVAELLSDADGSERLTAWNHLAGTLCGLTRYDEAERILTTALQIVPETNQDRAYLLDTLADVHEGRAKALHTQAEALGARNCGIQRRSQPEAPATPEEVRDEFLMVFATAGQGIVSAELRHGDHSKLVVFVADWNTVAGLPSRYRTLQLVLAAYEQPGTALSPSALIDGPGPELVRQT